MKRAVICLILMAVLASANPNAGYFMSYEKNGNMKPSQSNIEVTNQSLLSLMKQNFALNGQIKTEQDLQIVKHFAKGNFLNPIQMNFFYIFETSKNIQAIEDSMLTQSQITPVTVDLSGKNQIIDEIYAQKPTSLKNIAATTYKNQEANVPFYLFSTESIQSKVFQDNGITIQVVDNQEMNIVDVKSGKVIKKVNVETCVNDFVYPVYQLNLKDGVIYKANTEKKLPFTISNFQAVQTLLHEVCALSQLSKLFVKGEIPNLITFYFRSLAEIDQNFSDAELPFVYEMWRLAIKRAENNFKLNFKEDELFGEILFVNSIKDVVAIDTGLKPRVLLNIVLAEVKTTVAQSVSNTIISIFGSNSQLFIWSSIAMIYITYYICSSIWNMRVQKDSLLYAKFLTTDAK